MGVIVGALSSRGSTRFATMNARTVFRSNSCRSRWERKHRGHWIASMNIGFHPDTSQSNFSETQRPSDLIVKPEFGLTMKQMEVLGLTKDAMTKLPTVETSVSGILLLSIFFHPVFFHPYNVSLNCICSV